MRPADTWDPAAYASGARFVSDYGEAVVDLLDPRPGERVLDLGCGDGALTRTIVDRGAEVVGVDASPAMVKAARDRGVDARTGRAEALDLEGEFDAVFSNAALHWVTEADAAIAGIARALRLGGRLVVEQGGEGNVEAVRRALSLELGRRHGLATDLSEVWHFPSVEEHAARLVEAGFEVVGMVLAPRPTDIGVGMEDWLRTLAAPILGMVPAGSRDELVLRTVERLEPRLRKEGRWIVDYVRLRYQAVLRERRS